MELNNNFSKIFRSTPILGMLHLAGSDPVERALEELNRYEKEGLDGAIVENYHGSTDDVVNVLEKIRRHGTDIVIGINILPNEFHKSIPLAGKYEAGFVQLDHVAGRYVRGELDYYSYCRFRKEYPDIVVLGGVWPKYYTPMASSDLEEDLRTGMERAEAIVVTGKKTGQRTPTDKIKQYRSIIGNHPLIVGSGLTAQNAYEKLCIADGAIVGTYFKFGNDTINMVDPKKVRELMAEVKKARKYKESSF